MDDYADVEYVEGFDDVYNVGYQNADNDDGVGDNLDYIDDDDGDVDDVDYADVVTVGGYVLKPKGISKNDELVIIFFLFLTFIFLKLMKKKGSQFPSLLMSFSPLSTSLIYGS